MANQFFQKAATAAKFTHQVDFAAGLTFTNGAADTKFQTRTPGYDAVGETLDAPGAGFQYVIEMLTVSANAATNVGLFKASGQESTDQIWGLHAIPAAGIYTFYFPGGLKVGENAAPYPYSDSGSADGLFEIQGFIAPAG